MRWRELHGYGSRRSRGLSFGSAGRTVNVWRISLGRLREGTRAVTALAPKALDAKTKELIALGIGIAIRCDDCIAFHIKAAVERGATREEISETLGMAIYMGAGPSVMYASHAFAALQQFEAEKTA